MGCCGSKEGGGKGKGGMPKLERKEFKKVEIEDVDGVFDSAQEACDNVTTASENIDNANGAIIALSELEELKDKLADKAGDIKEVIKVLFADLKKNKITPVLNLAEDFSSMSIDFEAKPDGYIGKAIDAVKTLIEALQSLFEAVPKTMEDVQALVEKAKEFADPEKAKSMVADAGITGMAALSAVRNMGANVKSLGGVPGEITALVTACKELLTTLKDAISGDCKDENPAK